MEVLESNLDLSALFPKNKKFESFPPLKATFNSRGEFSALEFSNLKISNSIIDYYGGIESKNIFDPNSLRLDFLIDSLQIYTQQLDSISIIPDKKKPNLLWSFLFLMKRPTIPHIIKLSTKDCFS